MKNHGVMYGTLAACVLMAAGAPVALGQSASRRGAMVERIRQQEDSRRQSASASTPAPKASSQSRESAAPSRSTPPAASAPSGRAAMVERIRQSATPARGDEPSRSAPTQPAPSVARPSHSGGSNDVAVNRQRLIEAVSRRGSGTPSVQEPARPPSRSSASLILADRERATVPSPPNTGAIGGSARETVLSSVRRSTPPSTGVSASRAAIAHAVAEQNKAKAAPAPPSTGVDRPLVESSPPRSAGRGEAGSLPHQTMVDRARQLRDERVGTDSVPPAPFTGVERNAAERDGWSGSARDRGGDHRGGHDWNPRGRDDRDGWSRRDHGRWDGRSRDCDDDGWRSGWSFGLSIGSGGWGLSASYGWGVSRYCGPTYIRWCDWRPRRYVYDACDYRWDWCSPVVVRTSWHRPLASVCCWESCHSSYHSAWCYKTLVTTYVPVYFTTSVAGYGTVGSVQTFVNDGYAGVTPVAVAAPATIVVPPMASRTASVAVTYRANEKAGVLDWADTPARIVGALQDAPESMRGELAGRYLGRTVAGAWELIVERVQPSGDRTMLVCAARGASDRPSPIVALMVDAAPTGLKEGAIIVASGRIVEVTLNDPDAPSGVMVLDEVKIAR